MDFYPCFYGYIGTYDYQCDPHVGMGMTGEIIVSATF